MREAIFSSQSADANLPPASTWSIADTGIAGALILVAAVCVAVIQPNGNFPLNDDWAYILPVQWLVEHGQLRLTDWQFMTLLGQVFLGALVSAASSFSITGLRLLALALAALAVVLIYAIGRLMQASRASALAMALLLLCNPIFMVTSASFMTDTPFLAMCLLAVFFFLLGQQKERSRYVVLAWFFVFYACSVRQAGIALAVGFVGFYAVRFGMGAKTWWSSILPTLLAVMLLVAFPTVIDRTIGLPSMYRQPTQEATAFVVGVLHLKLGYLWMAAKTLLTALFYLGLCVVPLLPLVLFPGSNRLDKAGWRRAGVTVALAILVVFLLNAVGRGTPVPGNTFFDFGLGVRTLPNDASATTAPAVFWWVLNFLSTLGVVAIVRMALKTRLSPRGTGQAWWRNRSFHAACVAMLTLMLVAYNAPFLTRGGIWFDRYTLPNLAFFSVLVAPFVREEFRWRANWVVTSMLASAYLCLAVLGTHDYLEWNRQRWAAAAETAQTYGVTFDQIDGGFEYNNYEARRAGDHRRLPEQVLVENPSAAYRIAFSPLPQHQILKVIPCRTWLYGSPSKIFVLKALH